MRAGAWRYRSRARKPLRSCGASVFGILSATKEPRHTPGRVSSNGFRLIAHRSDGLDYTNW
jgi:hypothetical protein